MAADRLPFVSHSGAYSRLRDRHWEKSKSCHYAGCRSGETRTRNGDTTIFSRVGLLLSQRQLQGFASISECRAVSAFSRTLRSFPV